MAGWKACPTKNQNKKTGINPDFSPGLVMRRMKTFQVFSRPKGHKASRGQSGHLGLRDWQMARPWRMT